MEGKHILMKFFAEKFLCFLEVAENDLLQKEP
jgi:hypothetical protein